MAMALAAPTDSFPFTAMFCVAQQPWKQHGVTGRGFGRELPHGRFGSARTALVSAGTPLLALVAVLLLQPWLSPAAQDVLGCDRVRCVSSWPTNHFL